MVGNGGCRMGLLDIVGILCDAGADLNLKNHHGRVPLDESRTQRIYQVRTYIYICI